MSDVNFAEGYFYPLTIKENEIRIDDELLDKHKIPLWKRWLFPANWKTITVPQFEPAHLYEPASNIDLALHSEDFITEQYKIPLPDTIYRHLWTRFTAESLTQNLNAFNRQKSAFVEYENTLTGLLNSAKWWPKRWLFAKQRAEIAAKLQTVQQKHAILDQHATFCAGVAANYLNVQISTLTLETTAELIQNAQQTMRWVTQNSTAQAITSLIHQIDNPNVLLARANEYMKASDHNASKKKAYLKNAQNLFIFALDLLKNNKPKQQQKLLNDLQYFIKDEEWQTQIYSNVSGQLNNESICNPSELVYAQANNWKNIIENSGLEQAFLSKAFDFIKKHFNIQEDKSAAIGFDQTLVHLYYDYVSFEYKKEHECEKEIYKAYAFYLLCNHVLLPGIQHEYDSSIADNVIIDCLKSKITNIVKGIEDFRKTSDEVAGREKWFFSVLKKLLNFLGAWDETFDKKMAVAEGKRIQDKSNQNIELFREKVRELYHLKLENSPEFSEKYNGFLRLCREKTFSALPEKDREIIDFFNIIANDKIYGNPFNNLHHGSVAKIIEKINGLNAYLHNPQKDKFSAEQVLIICIKQELDYILGSLYPDKEAYTLSLNILSVYDSKLAAEYTEKEKNSYNNQDTASIYSTEDIPLTANASLPIIAEVSRAKRTASMASRESNTSTNSTARAAEAMVLRILIDDDRDGIKNAVHSFIGLLSKSLKNVTQWTTIFKAAASKKEIDDIVAAFSALEEQLSSLIIKWQVKPEAIDLLNGYLSRLTDHLNAWYDYFLFNYRHWEQDKIIKFADNLLKIPFSNNSEIKEYKIQVKQILDKYQDEEHIVSGFSAMFSGPEFSLKSIETLKTMAGSINKSIFLERKTTFLEVLKNCITQTLRQLSVFNITKLSLTYEGNKIILTEPLVSTFQKSMAEAVGLKISNLDKASTMQKKVVIKTLLQSLAILELLDADVQVTSRIRTDLQPHLQTSEHFAKPPLPKLKSLAVM